MLLHNKRKFFAICNWMQSLEESALDRSAGLFRPPGKPTIADDDDHHCRRRRASRLLSHFTCFFPQSFSDWQCVPAYFWPYASMRHLYALQHAKSWQCGTFHSCFPGSINQAKHLAIQCMYESTLTQKMQKIFKNDVKQHWQYFCSLSASFPSPDSSFDEDRPQSVSSTLPENSFISSLQRLTIIESPTPDDYDYYDEFSQVTLLEEIWNLLAINFSGKKG